MRPAKLLTLAFVCSASALPVLTLPWFGHISLDGLVEYLGYASDFAEDRTIYQILKDDEQYSRLVKAIDLSESVVNFLNDPCKSVTFFALPNSRLPGHKSHHGDDRHEEGLISFLSDDPSDVGYSLGDLVQQAEELEKQPETYDKDRCKDALACIVHKIIAYHILPRSYEYADLIQSSTYATNLTLDDGSLDSQPLRLSVLSTPVPPRLKLNRYSEVTKRDIKARNGVIHQISQPLLPPPSIFQEAFFVPEVFSIYTSAIQRVGLTGAIDRWRRNRDDGHGVRFFGATATTAFVPTSDAFKRLPKKLRLYLFSPIGQKALKKLLEYHIIPNFILHTDYIHNATSGATENADSYYFDDALEEHFTAPVSAFFDEDAENLALFRNTGPFPELVYEYNATLPTLLEDHHVRVHIARYGLSLPIPGFPRYFTRFRVNGHRVGRYDITARNGALHVLSTILDPRKGHDFNAEDGDDDDSEDAWEDWEEWFPQWAMED